MSTHFYHFSLQSQFLVSWSQQVQSSTEAVIYVLCKFGSSLLISFRWISAKSQLDALENLFDWCRLIGRLIRWMFFPPDRCSELQELSTKRFEVPGPRNHCIIPVFHRSLALRPLPQRPGLGGRRTGRGAGATAGAMRRSDAELVRGEWVERQRTGAKRRIIVFGTWGILVAYCWHIQGFLKGSVVCSQKDQKETNGKQTSTNCSGLLLNWKATSGKEAIVPEPSTQ